MKIYVFKSKLTEKFGLPVYAETDEEIKFNMENYLLRLFHDKKAEELRANLTREIYYIGTYENGIINPSTKKVLICDLKTLYEEAMEKAKHENI